MSTKLMGHVPNLTNEEYHAHEALSSSNIKTIGISPLHYKCFVIDGYDKEKTKDMELGTLTHSPVLENEFNYVCEPIYTGPKTNDELKAEITSLGGKPKGTKKELIAQLKSLNPNFVSYDDLLSQLPRDKTVLSKKDFDMISGMVKSSKEHQPFQDYLFNAMIEQSFFVEFDGIYMKARPDILKCIGNDIWIVGDYKTCQGSDIRSFTKKIFDLDYHISMVHYIQVLSVYFNLPKTNFIPMWFAHEKTYPYILSQFDMGEDLEEYSWREYNAYLNKIKTCIQSNQWPAYQEDIETIHLPSWLKHSENNDARIIEGE